ncbi:cytidylyltransferase domain-containing protein [Aridibaculum aurantiacum]|uniref:acylneuraminate cytidylyltransferase family protein n=1 Tax=Aridibaculum aurantiacum TaxID=2810307 RepID=UPI001A95C519|nr:acylneuraminate cytidylyltransferase family protein [Aridibaculum aurantiacum]
MKNLCIIPARSGSKGVPGKNIKLLNGRPLIHYTIEAALSSSLLDNTIISTDSEKIAAMVKGTGVKVPFIRPANLAQDNTPTFHVIKHAIQFFDCLGEMYDNVVLLQPTCPFREMGFVDRCIEHFVATGADSLVSVQKVPHQYNPHWVFEPNLNGFLKIATGEEKIIPSRQQLPDAFVRDGSVYVFKADSLRHSHNMYGHNIAMLESTSPYHVNIDTPADWEVAEALAEAIHARSCMQ